MSRLVYFVGGGRMARAMAQGMVAGGLIEPQQLVVIDHSSVCQDWWAEHMPSVSIYKSAAEANAAQPATAQDVVILAVKPQHVRSCIDDFREASPAGWSKHARGCGGRGRGPSAY